MGWYGCWSGGFLPEQASNQEVLTSPCSNQPWSDPEGTVASRNQQCYQKGALISS